jgi:hypothetical protein
MLFTTIIKPILCQHNCCWFIAPITNQNTLYTATAIYLVVAFLFQLWLEEVQRGFQTFVSLQKVDAETFELNFKFSNL